MTDPKKIALVGVGLVGLYLLSGRGKDAAGGGGFGGAGDGEPLGDDVTITFPELDLSQIWGDAGLEAPLKKDMSQLELDVWAKDQPWYDVLPAGGETIGDWFRAQPESSKITSNILRPMDISPGVADTGDTKKQMFTLPFFGATGAPTFSSWLKTHNIFGKRIAGATAPPPSLATKKAVSGRDGLSSQLRRYEYLKKGKGPVAGLGRPASRKLLSR